MKLIYWMIFQILIGSWLVLSPFLLEIEVQTAFTASTMILGALVITMAVAMIVYDFYGTEDPEKLAEELHTGTHLKSS